MSEPTTFQENQSKEQDELLKKIFTAKPKKKNRKFIYYNDPNANQCRRCGNKDRPLFKDARGYMICDFCKERGFYIGVKKMSKKEKKRFKAMQRDIQAGKLEKIPHTTYDRKGNVVE